MRKSELEEPAFRGPAGKTRRETVFWTGADGVARSAAVTRVVDTATDRRLADALVAGTLHRGETGVDIALSVVVHDAEARRVVIYLPESLRHLELAERIRWLSRVMEDPGGPVPRYVMEPRVAVGLAELRAALAEPAGAFGARREAVLAEREEAVTRREEAVALREQRLRERAEQLTRREDEVRERAEEAEASARDLAMRESELEARLSALVDRERRLLEREREARSKTPSTTASVRSGSLDEVEDVRDRMPLAGPLRPSYAPPSPIAALVPDEDVEEIDELEPVSTSPGLRSDRTGRFSADRSSADVGSDAVIAPGDAVEEVDDDEVEEEVDDAMLATREEVTGLHSAPAEPDGPSPTPAGADPDLSGPRTAIVSQDAVPASARDAELQLMRDDGLELWSRLDARQAARLGESLRAEGAAAADDTAPRDVEGELDLLVQMPSEDAPAELRGLVVVTLLGPERSVLGRLVLDPRNGAERASLEAMRRRMDLRVVFHDGSQRLFERRLQVPRELNVARILERASRLRGEPSGSEERAVARSLDLPGPERHVLSGDAVERATSPAAVRAVLADVAEALDADRLDDAMVHYSVPRDAVDATVARAIEKALAFGLALPATLVERAVAMGLAPDAGEIVSQQIKAFRKAAVDPNSGLEPEAIADNWARLLKAATDHEIALDSETYDLAWSAIRSARGSDGSEQATEAEVDPGRLADAGVPELLLMLEHPRYRQAAAIALAERTGAEHVEALCRAARKMPRDEVVKVVPRIARIGEEAGDALIDGLSAKKTFVRHAFALALGHLKLRRAVVPLLHLLREEESDVWRDVARIVGTFGNASLRAISRQFGEAGKTTDERTIAALAHLANHGCDEAIVAMTKESDPRTVQLATSALAQRLAARDWEEQVLGKRPLDTSQPVLVFARRFLAELAGREDEGALDSIAD